MKTHHALSHVLTALLAGCGETPSSAPDDQKTAAAVAPVAIGEAGHARSVDITLTSVAEPNQIGLAGVGPKAEAGETFVVVSYTIKNTGDAPLPLMERPALGLLDAAGQTYAPDETASLMAAGLMSDPSGMAADLNPNVAAKTKAAWKVDKKAFNRAEWKVVAASDPALTFSLK